MLLLSQQAQQAATIIRLQGGSCQQKHRHRNAGSKIGPGGPETRPETQEKRPTTNRNSGTLPRPKGFLYQRSYRKLTCFASARSPSQSGHASEPRGTHSRPLSRAPQNLRVFMFFDPGPGASGGPRKAPLSYPWAFPGPPGGPRDLRQTKAKNLET